MAPKNKMNKNQLVAALREAGVAFDKKAKVDKLRRIYDEAIGQNAVSQKKNDDVTVPINSETLNSDSSAAKTAPKTTTNIPIDVDSENVQKNSDSAENQGIKFFKSNNSDSSKVVGEREPTDDEIQRRLDEIVLHVPTATEIEIQIPIHIPIC